MVCAQLIFEALCLHGISSVSASGPRQENNSYNFNVKEVLTDFDSEWTDLFDIFTKQTNKQNKKMRFREILLSNLSVFFQFRRDSMINKKKNKVLS